jgi:hypothetical protein
MKKINYLDKALTESLNTLEKIRINHHFEYL